jgi:hypothetical protein
MIEENNFDYSKVCRTQKQNYLSSVPKSIQDPPEEFNADESYIPLIKSDTTGKLNNRHNDIFTPSGIAAYDIYFGGLVLNSLNLFRTSSYEASIVALGAFISHGLRNDERVSLVGFSNPKHIIYKLARYGYTDLEKYINSEQLVYLYYKPFFEKQIGLSTGYGEMVDELIDLSGQDISRLALDNCEIMFNQQSQKLAKTSAIKLLLATERRSFTTLGVFTNESVVTDYLLDQICESTMESYASIERDSKGDNNLFRFTVKKSPETLKTKTICLELNTGIGFV